MVYVVVDLADAADSEHTHTLSFSRVRSLSLVLSLTHTRTQPHSRAHTRTHSKFWRKMVYVVADFADDHYQKSPVKVIGMYVFI